MVLSSPMSVMAADEDRETVSEQEDADFSDGSDVTETPAPEPETPSPEPETPSPEPETPSPEPETPAPEPETPTPAPETPTPAPETPTPAPETPTPAPETPTVTPADPTATPTPTPAPTDVTETEATKKLVEKIDKLAKETLTLKHAAEVKELRKEYDSLADEQKTFVTNYDLLVGFEKRIAELHSLMIFLQ